MPVDDTDVQLEELQNAFAELNEEYTRLLDQVKFTHTLLSLILEEQGGSYLITRNDAENYDGMKTTISMHEVPDEDQFIISVQEREDNAVQ